MLQIAVLGPGGVGGLLAGLLARAGHHVVVVAPESTALTLATAGITVESARFGDFNTPVSSCVRLSTDVDVALVTVKAPQLEAALEGLPPRHVTQGIIVPLMNGIEHVPYLRARYPPECVAGATIRVESSRVSPGHVRHTSPFARVEIAANDGVRPHVARFADALEQTGIDVQVRDDEAAMLWGKLSFLAPFALMTTYRQGTAGDIRTRWRLETDTVIREVAAVANADGAAVDAEQVLGFLDSVPASMQSSMFRDQMAGLPLEIDAIGGAVLRRATAARIDVPVTARLVAAIELRAADSTTPPAA